VVLDGQVIAQCQPRHRHSEWLKFLRQIDRATPKDKTLHLIADNYATPKPFIRTKSARDILQKVIRANSRLSSKQNAALYIGSDICFLLCRAGRAGGWLR